MATQRDPNRQAVMLYVDLDLLAKVRTVIKGRKVPRKSAGTKRATSSMREMGMADFFIECAEKEVADVTPSRAAVAWCRSKHAGNVSARARNQAARSTPEEKDRQLKFQMRAYFEGQIKKKELALARIEARNSADPRAEALRANVVELRGKFAEYEEACKAYSDRRRREAR